MYDTPSQSNMWSSDRSRRRSASSIHRRSVLGLDADELDGKHSNVPQLARQQSEENKDQDPIPPVKDWNTESFTTMTRTPASANRSLMSPILPSLQESSIASFHIPQDEEREKDLTPINRYEVIVFGFPSSRAAEVINYFSKNSEIVSRNDGPGNWTRLRYKTPLQAEMALKQNGIIINGDVMVGVKRAPLQPDQAEEYLPIPSSNMLYNNNSNINDSSSIFLRNTNKWIVERQPWNNQSFWMKAMDYVLNW